MRALGGSGLANQAIGGRPGGACRGPRAALLALLVLCGLLGAVAPAGASSARDSAQSLLARLAVQQTQLTAADGAVSHQFGNSVAISGDTALVGARWYGTGGKIGPGAAYVFVRSGGSWTQQAKLTAADGVASDEFGTSVAISGDTALVGEPYRGSEYGAAYVFVRAGSSWTAQAKLTASDRAAGDHFGYSVALSGETALIGALGHDTAGKKDAGAAYVVVLSGGSWTQQAKLTAADGAAGDEFGASVAVSGETALVGAPGHGTAGKEDAGAAYVFARSGGSWTQQDKPIAADGADGDSFGGSVAISAETALVGAVGHDSAGKKNAGAAYVFVRAGGSWKQQASLTATDGAPDDLLGWSVAVSGETALVGVRYHDTAGKKDAGAAYVFVRAGGSWTQQDKPIAADGAAGDAFGSSVALSGATALIGARFHDTAGKADSGAAYVFLTAPTVTSFLPASGPIGATVKLTGAGFSGATAVSFNGSAAASFSVDSDAQITATVPAGATTGLIAVTAPGGTGTSAASFTVIPTPAIARLAPTSGKRGATVTITGSGFGAVRGAGSVKYGATKCTTFLSWGDGRIKCKVPAKAKYGTVKVVVTTAGGASKARSFWVKR